MKRTLFLILFISTNLIHSQEKSIENYVAKVDNLEHIGCVNSILLEEVQFRNNQEKIDTLKRIHKVFFDNKNNISKQLDYSNTSGNPFRTVIFDSLNRILNVKIIYDNQSEKKVVQYFGSDLKYPDSLKVYSKDLVENRKIINHFKHNLVIRRDLLENDTLRYFTLFEYDSKKRLTKELNINTKDGFGIISKFTGSPIEKTMYRNDSVLYTYRNSKDTIIVNRKKYKGGFVSEKSFQNDSLEIKIKEEIAGDEVFMKSSTFTWKDSTKTKHLYYKLFDDKPKELKSYYNSSTYKDRIVSEWKDPFMIRDGLPENVETTIIMTSFDKYGNWINKSFIRNESKEKEINRIIEYNCH